MSRTPGPWIRDRESGFDCDVRAANGRKIASVNVQNQPKSKEGWALRKKENEANARLIASAPELLEALEEIVSAADGDGWSHLDADLRKARAAIAKATGGDAA